MNSIKKIIISISVLTLLVTFALPPATAEPDQIITDGLDDVIYTSAMNADQEEIEYTSERPNVDIETITYVHAENSKEVSIILKVKGVIEDRNDFEDLNDTDYFGSMISYFTELETNYSAYQLEYTNKTCTVDGESASYSVDGSELTITFDLYEEDETFVSLISYTTEMSFVSLTDINIYMDIAPNEALFIASISGPYSGETKTSLSFSGTYDDFLLLSEGPYTYSWDWDDGTSKGSGSNPTHSYQYPGNYEIELTIEDSSGLSSSATHEITISEKSVNNGGNGGNNNDEGSGLMLFIMVVVIIVIIGVVALVVVIRR